MVVGCFVFCGVGFEVEVLVVVLGEKVEIVNF